jgi:hypothetical protein
MPSEVHQSLLLWGVRRMAADGFVIAGFDGRAERGGGLNDLPAPISIHGVRADACGVHRSDGMIAFAEAKTEADIDNRHTRKQLRILGHARLRESPCPLYIAVPRSCAYALDRVLIDTGLIGLKHVRRLHVPDVLLTAAA